MNVLLRRPFLLPAAYAAIIILFAVAYRFVLPVLDHISLTPLYAQCISGQGCPLTHYIGGGNWYLTGNNILLRLALWTHWSHEAELAVQLAVVTATLIVWLRFVSQHARERGLAPWAAAPALFLGAFFLFSPDQYNLLWPYQLSLYLCLFCIVQALTLLGSPNLTRGRLLACAACAAVAVYSHGAGMLLLLTVLALLPLHPSCPRPREAMIGWAALCVVLIGHTLYKWDHYRPPGGEGSQFAALLNLPVLLEFIATYLGGALLRWTRGLETLAGAAGIIGAIVLAVHVLRQKALRRDARWLTYGGLLLLVPALGILTFIGTRNAGNIRYITMANLFWLALSTSALLYMPPLKQAKPLLAALLALIVLKAAASLSGGTALATQSRLYRQVAEMLRQEDVSPISDETLTDIFYAKPEDSRRWVQYMKDHHLGYFRK